MQKRSKRFRPFGGNKKSGQHAAEIRERENRIHELEQMLSIEKLRRESRENELQRYLTFPHSTVRELVFKVSFGDAVQLGIEPQLSRLLAWMNSKSGLAAWDEQIKSAVREILASGKQAVEEEHAKEAFAIQVEAKRNG